jgi:hypothetical protein
MSDTLIGGLVRQVLVPNYNEAQDAPVGMNNRGEQLIVESLPLKTELTRLGNTFSVAIATGNAFTYVNAWPTTRAELVLFNGEPSGGKSYVIDSAFLVDISSAAAAQSKALLAQLVAAATAPTDDTAQLITSRSGRAAFGAAYSGKAKRALANTAMGQIANRWELLGAINNPNAASIGSGLYLDLFGGWIVPPGAGLALAGLASTAAGTAIIGVTWHEVQLALGVGG